ncbi:interleukin-1 receptor-like 1 [Rhinatrema bivittatum]|uniref:interleukin-1 receptor-like 1 n=1 Tax=Rhinatrema bivittatum TaxID=194408 RepID=UPI00112E0A8B|nr:interleukin-1 receptor-like 1 [Rhinatrema bivittatum]
MPPPVWQSNFTTMDVTHVASLVIEYKLELFPGIEDLKKKAWWLHQKKRMWLNLLLDEVWGWRYFMRLFCLVFLHSFLSASKIPPSCDESKNFKVAEGEVVIIKCNCMSRYDVNVNITWFSEDGVIPNEERMRLYASGEFLRIIPTVQRDTGKYACFIQRDPDDSSHCCQMTLTVYQYEPGTCFTHEMLYLPIIATEASAKIVCRNTDHYANPSKFTWYKDCRPLQGKKYSIISDKLLIKGVNKSDEGNYTCKFIYLHKGKEYNVTRTMPLNIKEHTATKFPMIESPRNGTMEVQLDSATNITCSAFLGYGHRVEGFVWWVVNGNELAALDPLRFHGREQSFQKPNNELVSVSVLMITKIKEEDLTSNFTCTALNSMGWQESTITLILPAKDYRKHVLISAVGLLTSFALMIILYIFCRVDIVLLYREIFKSFRITHDGKVYDAYVVYPRNNNTDKMKTMEYFVHKALLDVLENQCGYKLYVPGRNMLPGEDIASAAEMNIKKSRRLIIILTSQIMNCEEFAYEQQIGLYDALIKNDLKVILIEMEKINKDSELQESLKHIIKQKGAIKWNEGIMANAHSPNTKFWKYVRYQMPGRYQPSQPSHAS